MKIAAIDDQKLVRLSLEKHFSSLGYEIRCADTGRTGIDLIYDFQPDLIIMDIHMEGMSGLEVVKKLRKEGSKVPIIIMSGNTNEETVVEGFDLGIEDFIKKPAQLSELTVRVRRLIGVPMNTEARRVSSNSKITKGCVGVVIPCYNEETRLLSKEFSRFIASNLGYHLCFVNDGSTDNTLEVLQQLSFGREDYISVYNCEKNGGKGEAVRQGMLHLVKDKQLDYLGYLDADLSTDFKDFDDLVNTINSSDYKLVSGSRITRMGATIHKESSREIISFTINLIIRKILGMHFKDTQCGAKIIHRDLVEAVFREKFITRWLFDVEIFKRMRNIYGREQAVEMICEQPLNRWVHEDGSKLSMKDSFSIIGQLFQISSHYKQAH